MRQLFRSFLAAGALAGASASSYADCPPRSANDVILNSVDQFIIRQMEKFPTPSDYPVGYENARLLQTYDVDATHDLYYRADVYDSALAAMYILERGSNFFGGGYLERARSIVDGIRLVEDHDPEYEHAVRTSYKADDLYDGNTSLARIDQGDVGVGNMCFAAVALHRFHLATREDLYLDAAREKADFIDANFRQEDANEPVFDGFSLGIDAAGVPHHRDGRSTEHNADVYALARNIAEVWAGPDTYENMADHAQDFVDKMYDSEAPQGKYWTGTIHDDSLGRVINYWPIFVDGQSWTTLASVGGPHQELQVLNRVQNAMAWAWDNLTEPCPCECDNCFGMRFSNGGENLQTEVSAGAAMAYLLLGDQAKEENILACLDWIRLNAPGSDPTGIGLVATPDPDGASTGWKNQKYLNKRHVASTVWFGLAVMLDEDPTNLWANPFAVVPELGDVNGDGVVNSADVIPFLDVLLGGPFNYAADMNQDTFVNGLDIDPFVAVVQGGGTQAVPEPSTLLLAVLALFALGCKNR